MQMAVGGMVPVELGGSLVLDFLGGLPVGGQAVLIGIGDGVEACEALAPEATGRRRGGARGTSLTCEANPRHRQHA
jgi:hypothetical protein